MVPDIRSIPKLVNSGKLRLKADIGMATFPCQSQSVLKELNGYSDLNTADLFRGSLRFEIMDLLNIKYLVEENVPPNPKTTEDYNLIKAQAENLGYRTQVDFADAACFGGGQSRLRAILLTTKSDLYTPT